MSSGPDAAVPAPGFFGKLPSRGDFLSRRLPPGLAAPWEAWLQAMVVEVRAAAAPGWQDAWLTAPLWHFTLGAALAPPHGAAGVLVASADRVGRLFPFSVLGGAAPCGAADAAGWAATAEALVLAALDEGHDPASLDTALLALGPPPPPRGPGGREGAWALVLAGDWPAAGDPLADDAPGAGPRQSDWWCRGSDRVPPLRLRCTGLPAARLAAAMMMGGDDLPRPAGQPVR